jgi:hypothetical protein
MIFVTAAFSLLYLAGMPWTRIGELVGRRRVTTAGATCRHDPRRQVLRDERPQDLDWSGSAVFQTTSVKMRIPRNTLWALCTAIPIQALRYRFVGYAVVNISSSVPGIAHGTCRW